MSEVISQAPLVLSSGPESVFTHLLFRPEHPYALFSSSPEYWLPLDLYYQGKTRDKNHPEVNFHLYSTLAQRPFSSSFLAVQRSFFLMFSSGPGSRFACLSPNLDLLLRSTFLPPQSPFTIHHYHPSPLSTPQPLNSLLHPRMLLF